MNENAYGGKKPVWDKENVYIFSPSIFVDDTDRFYRDYFNCYAKFEDSILREIIAKQEALPKKERPRILVVLNDQVGLLERNSTINWFASRYRHYNASMIFNTQVLKGVAPIVRTNASNILLFNGMNNARHWKDVDEEFGGGFRDTLTRLYYGKAQKKYSFLH